MGSATREARDSSRAALAALGRVDLATAEDLFSAGRVIGDSSQLQALLADTSIDAAEKVAIIAAVFGSVLGGNATKLLGSVASSRWSSRDDLLAGIEELAFRAAAESASAGVDIEAQLFAFGRAVSSSSELELAIGGGRGDSAAKLALVDSLLAKKVAPQTLVIVRHLIQQPRGRRIRTMLDQAAAIVADQAGQSIATITTAVPLAAAQLERLRAGLSLSYGRELRVNQIVDPAVIGGVRVQIGDDVLDGSIASKLRDLQLQLAG
jgi:F-type H+-transporting ATPase subunit delta